MIKKSKRQLIEMTRAQLMNERSSFIAHWKDIANHVSPRRARFNVTDANKGNKQNQKINDTTATMSARTLRSGLMGGVTSPARDWFKLSISDPDLSDYGPVREYLHRCQVIMTASFLKSNLYNTLPLVYGDLGTFGTAPMAVTEELSKRVFHTSSFPIGSYAVAKDYTGRVNTFVRDFQMTVAQVVETFGEMVNGEADWSNFSPTIKRLYEEGNYQAWVQITHCIMPNREYDPKKLESKYKKYIGVYYERGASQGQNNFADNYKEDRFLEEKGFDLFPILCPRWEVTGEDVYGTDCPGMTALSDIKSLQLGERMSYEAVDKMVNPPMMGSSALRSEGVSFIPGDMTYIDRMDQSAGAAIRPIYQIAFDINPLEMKQNQTRQRVQRAFYEDLFLMLANDQRSNITAEEIRGKKEERLLALGPVLEQLNQDLLDPLIDLTFDFHNRQGLLPEPPPELQGQDLKVEYISVMAQAQKLIGIGGADRFLGTVGAIAQYDQSVIQKVKADRILDDYADMLSVPPSWIRTQDEMDEIKAQQAEAQRAEQAMAQIQQASAAAKNLSQAPLDNDSALSALMGRATAGA